MATLPRSLDARASPRDEVLFRTRGTGGDGRALTLVIVNVSETGFMARCDAAPAPGTTLRVELPPAGCAEAEAEVRWSLGGRIGCRFAMPVADYPALLAALRGR